MLALLALLVASVYGSVYDNLLEGISAGTTTQDMIVFAILNQHITMDEMSTLAQAMQQAAIEAAAAAATQDCSAQRGADRYQTPVINGIIGYGNNMCSSLPPVYFTNPTVSSDVPDLSGVYTMDGGPCPAHMSGGNQLRIEQDGDQIIFIGHRVVHHFKKEAAGCEPVCLDVQTACSGRPASQVGPRCSTGQVTGVPDKANNCWNLHATFVTVSWCKTATGVSRAVNGIVTYTATLVE